jgi:hypothetical protein
MPAAVNDLLCDAMRKRCRGLSGLRVATSAWPNASSKTMRWSQETATAQPGCRPRSTWNASQSRR